jgi:hypothetical protein
VGAFALEFSQGTDNTAIGAFAGDALDGDEFGNILIGHPGVSGENRTIRIGASAGLGHEATYIAGISGATSAGGTTVLVNADGKLGTTTSSARFKEQIESLAPRTDVAERLLSLRAVSFRYRPEVAGVEDPPLEYGLIAEEVAELFPELVLADEQGRPSVVRYNQLIPLLLEEIQRLRRDLSSVERKLRPDGSRSP